MTIDALFFILALFALLLYLGYHYKNLYLVLSAAVVSLIIASMIWITGVTSESGATMSGSVSGAGFSLTQTMVFSPVNFGFPQAIIGSFFAILGLFLFWQAIGGLVEAYR